MISYMDRTRTYYARLGYPAYQWANYNDVPFCVPEKPIAQAKLALITTAAPYQDGLGEQGPGAAYNAAAKFFRVYTTALDPPPNLRISHLGYDRVHTSAADTASFLPITALQRATLKGHIGALADECIGVPTNRSQRVTLEQDAPAVLTACRKLQADVALLVPT